MARLLQKRSESFERIFAFLDLEVTATVDALAADKLIALLRPDLPMAVRVLLFEVIHNVDAVMPRPGARAPSFEDDVDSLPRPSADLRDTLVSTNSNPERVSEAFAAAAATLDGDRDAAPLAPCLLYTSPSPRDLSTSRMPSSA